MSLGKNYEMAHQNPSEQLTNSELWEEREQAIANLSNASLFFDSVATEFSKAQQEANIPADLWEVNNEAHKRKIAATGWLMDVNRRITQAGL